MERRRFFSLGAAGILGFGLTLGTTQASSEKSWVVYDGFPGPGEGKEIVLVSGDEEYRSEETLPQLGKILAKHHGFRCTVLFPIDPESGVIEPDNQRNIPGLHHLKDADLMVLFTRFRDLPKDQMEHIVDYVRSGRPIIGMRTATHAFQIDSGKPYAHYDWRSDEWPGGFGRQVLGETWIAHHGDHGQESTRGILADAMKDHPVLRGIDDGDIWGPTDVYKVRLPLPGDSKPLVLGEVLDGMDPDSAPVEGKKNDPMMPVAWIKHYESKSGKKGRVFTTTMGASQDFKSEGLRRLLVNATYWAVGMESKIPSQSKVELVGEYNPTSFGFDAHKEGVKPSDHAMSRP